MLVAIYCPIPTIPFGTTVSAAAPLYYTTVGTTLQVICNIGYLTSDTFAGSETLTCQTDGTWSPTPPTCISKLHILLYQLFVKYVITYLSILQLSVTDATYLSIYQLSITDVMYLSMYQLFITDATYLSTYQLSVTYFTYLSMYQISVTDATCF